ncbi:hypothetical protein PF005_g21934 [Phytophthora fragariae]|uniref:Uncharacterized protein n=1 Tax=Phytophthora fragariae TaxID=53985 RepID=A0A6A3REC5_9STRA|nr:hypothetical protein PF003_g25345 [Phytophthora fragariae]KAE8927039.1 hypothetical protein PF009_g22785 [Phytophthora fragariae]KAE8984882.1 hypothetical protein PF011_g20613 [Phytophthora fragariae]KAE9083307.1 hypothetical protein PF010_g21266 [Phytophthora fragariae]KAE9095335.1 hypothetical protein PF007_g17414 [Phytophthora fragariae]
MASIYCACFAAAASARHYSSRRIPPAILLNCDPIIQSKRIGLTDHDRPFDTTEPIVPVYRIGQRAHSTQ